jgi:hypothetical protein
MSTHRRGETGRLTNLGHPELWLRAVAFTALMVGGLLAVVGSDDLGTAALGAAGIVLAAAGVITTIIELVQRLDEPTAPTATRPRAGLLALLAALALALAIAL